MPVGLELISVKYESPPKTRVCCVGGSLWLALAAVVIGLVWAVVHTIDAFDITSVTTSPQFMPEQQALYKNLSSTLNGRTEDGSQQHPAPLSNPSAHQATAITIANGSACAFLSGRTAAIFIHSYPTPTNGWRRIFDDEMQTLSSSVLTACGVPAYLGQPSGTPWPFAPANSTPPFLAPLSASTRSDGGRKYEEVHTLAAIFEFCESRPSALVAYVHDKGTRSKAQSAPRLQVTPEQLYANQWDWRRLHEYFVLEVPQGCVGGLLSGVADLCGANYRSISVSVGRGQMRAAPHYSGNFWWATCAHIASLRHPFEYDEFAGAHMSKDISTMMWVASERRAGCAICAQHGRRARAISCWNSAVGDHHKEPYPRSRYSGAACTPETWKVFSGLPVPGRKKGQHAPPGEHMPLPAK